MFSKQIGFGYSTDYLSLTGNMCVDTNKFGVKFVDSTKSVLKFNGVTSYSETASQLGVDLSANVKICYIIGCMNFGASLDFYHYSQETDYTKSFIYSITTQLPSIRLDIKQYGISSLTKEAQLYYNQSIDDFRNYCGDEFVFQEQRGASLYISTKLDFVTKTEKNSFTISGTSFLGSILQFLNLQGQGVNDFFHSQRASLSIAVMQKGGDKSTLTKILPNLNWQNDEFTTFNCFSADSVNLKHELESCKLMMNSLLEYATNVFPNMIEQDNFNQSVVTSIYKKSYNFIGMYPGTTGLPPNVIDARNSLQESYDKFEKDSIFLSKLLQNMPESKKIFVFGNVQVGWNGNYIDSSTSTKLANTQKLLKSEISQAKLELQNCYNNLEFCSGNLPLINTDIIDDFKHAYIFRSQCGDLIFGPRYLLPIGKNDFLEDSFFLDLNMTVKARYSIIFGTNNITITNINSDVACADIVTKSESFDLLDIYRVRFYDECAQYICPAGLVSPNDIVDSEFIRVQTPI